MSQAPGLLAAAALIAAAGTASPQGIATRVDGAPDGRVEFTFAARGGVCGNGRSYIQTGPNNYTGTFYGNVNDGVRADPCLAGPVRVVIDRADKLPLSIQTYVGPPDTTLRGVTDLGRVRAQDAADYLLSLASKIDGRAGRDALLPAMLADSANTAAALVSIAKNTSLPRETRRSALSYMGRSTDGMQTIPASVTEPILAIARDESDNQSVRQQALSVLGRLDHGAGIPPLMQLSQQTQSTWLAKESMSTLARSGDPRARQYLRTAVRRTDLPDDVRTVALRALGQDYATAQDAALLRELYPTLESDRSREAVLSALADIGGSENTKWMIDLAERGSEPIAMRRRALDAASRAGASVTSLVDLYDTTTDPSMKQSLVGIYVRNGERPAIDKLLSILKSEDNLSVRRNAISQMSHSEDPRIKAALQEIVAR
ncbi:MAG TPA: HEAT repeat domain-containing protein [Gemmatimonadaceae bacterium]|jgi:HEAT repeat protein|nr:HEAT repeat domain-containing protein [Gemmatimonadaceae bacterium]